MAFLEGQRCVPYRMNSLVLFCKEGLVSLCFLENGFPRAREMCAADDDEFSSARERTNTPNQLQCGAIICRVLQRVAACCSVL